jgi:hypothetical protein
MFWLFKIAFSKKLRDAENKRRYKFYLENLVLLDEIKKLENMKNSIDREKAEDLSIMFLFNTKEAISNIEKINILLPYLFISDKDINKMQSYLKDVKDLVQDFANGFNLTSRIDGFYNKDKSQDSIFNRIQLNKFKQLDSFSFSR